MCANIKKIDILTNVLFISPLFSIEVIWKIFPFLFGKTLSLQPKLQSRSRLVIGIGSLSVHSVKKNVSSPHVSSLDNFNVKILVQPNIFRTN